MRAVNCIAHNGDKSYCDARTVRNDDFHIHFFTGERCAFRPVQKTIVVCIFESKL